MGYAERRAGYWRARYKLGQGKYGTVADEFGALVKFRTRREAEKAAADAEAKVRVGSFRDPRAGLMKFGDYANRWYAGQNLAASTMQNYRRHIEAHLLPCFEDMAINSILPSDVDAWEKQELAEGYAVSSVRSWRATLHLILSDAVADGLRDANPAARRRGRGKRAGRSRNRGPEKVVTDPLGMLLIAERAALLSGRDDEFVAIMLLGYTGIRWGELVGLEPKYIRGNHLRIESQLYELDSGELIRCPPKDDSYRTIDLPDFLAEMVSDHLARTHPKPCPCHGHKFVFRGYKPANGATRGKGATMADVARLAEVSTGTVSNVLNRPEAVPHKTVAKVTWAIEKLGYTQETPTGEIAWHWRRSGFATWLFQPAATGEYPARSPHPARPVPLLPEPWPGVPARGRGAAARAQACWLPVAKGLTPHGLRHSHKTLMEEAGVPPKLMDERMGHEDGSVQARYTHVTQEMRLRLLEQLARRWFDALVARADRSDESGVAVLQALLSQSDLPRLL